MLREAFLFLVAPIAVLGGSEYTVLVIPPPSGVSPVISMTGINNSGQVAGTGYTDLLVGFPQAFIGAPSGSVLVPLPPYGGYVGTFAAAINDQAQVAGSVTVYEGGIDGYGVFVGSATAVSGVPSFSPSYGDAINDAGQVAGTGIIGTFENMIHGAFLGTASAVAPIKLPSGWYATGVSGVNSSGQVVGWAASGANQQEFIATTSGGALVPMPPGWGGHILPFPPGAINDSGLAVGDVYQGTLTAAFVGTASSSALIPLPQGATFASVASQSLNNSGVVVGTSDSGGWIWDAADGTRLLNGSVPAGWNITNAISISNNGLILAQGSLNGGAAQYVELVPTVPTTPAPPACLLVIAGLGLLTLFKKLAPNM
jgi:hypothetical protein